VCLALALPTPTGLSPLPKGLVCYRGASLDDTEPRGRFAFEEGQGVIMGNTIRVYAGSGLKANVTFISHEHAPVIGVTVEKMHWALAGVHVGRARTAEGNSSISLSITWSTRPRDGGVSLPAGAFPAMPAKPPHRR
jgi:hypothetical protein